MAKSSNINLHKASQVQKLLGYKNPVAACTLYWMYEEETLDEPRRRMDSENNE
jgi:hypothetical protein